VEFVLKKMQNGSSDAACAIGTSAVNNNTKNCPVSPSNSSTAKNIMMTGGDGVDDESSGISASATVIDGGGAASSSSNMEKDDEDDCPSQNQSNLEESGDESNQSNDPGKMFIGGLSWQTSAENLRDYFSKFGDVNECMVMRDPTTKRARGFGFITFADPTSVEKVLADETHELDGKKIDPKVAFPKRTQPKMIVKTKKVFIGGLSSNSTLEDMKTYFQQYGKIEDAMLMFDKATQRHRGFGFITFDDDDVSDKVCEIHFHEINGKMVECKKAQPKEVMLPVQMNKNRAAAARNLYGLAPEQLLAYASYMPRIPPYSNAGVLYPTIFNGFSPSTFGMSPSGRSSTSNNGPMSSASASGSNSNALINSCDLAAVQQLAQRQAIYEATMAYSNQYNAMGGDFSAAFHPPPHNNLGVAASSSHHHQHPSFHTTTSSSNNNNMGNSSNSNHHLHHHHAHHHQQQQQSNLANSFNKMA
jgi:RNA-binding protein Musashi